MCSGAADLPILTREELWWKIIRQLDQNEINHNLDRTLSVTIIPAIIMQFKNTYKPLNMTTGILLKLLTANLHGQ